MVPPEMGELLFTKRPEIRIESISCILSVDRAVMITNAELSFTSYNVMALAGVLNFELAPVRTITVIFYDEHDEEIYYYEGLADVTYSMVIPDGKVPETFTMDITLNFQEQQ